MEIADHAGETNGPEPAEETGARQGRGENPPRGRTLTREKEAGEEQSGERGREEDRVSRR